MAWWDIIFQNVLQTKEKKQPKSNCFQDLNTKKAKWMSFKFDNNEKEDNSLWFAIHCIQQTSSTSLVSSPR